MAQNGLLFIFMLLSTTSLSTAIECTNSNNCVCIYNFDEYEFQCPQNYNDELNGYVMHATNDHIRIDCPQNLEHFEINKLPMVNIENASSIEIEFCPLPDNFKQIIDRFSIKQLTQLSFSHSNQSERQIGKDHFKGLSDLKSLTLYKNEIKALDSDVFEYTPNLMWIDLGANRLTLEKDYFKNLKFLRELNLGENRIQDIPTDVFRDLDKLERLYMWGNQLKKISAKSFSGLTALKNLDLSANRIEEIDGDVFKHMTNFTRVSLRKNNLRSIPSDLFTNNQQLEEIRIGNNENLNLPAKLFANMKMLKKVDLRNCNLKTIPNDLFLGDSNLEVIELFENQLKEIPDGLFEGLTNLKELHLNDNQFENLEEPFKKLNRLVELNLEGNSLKRIGNKLFKDLTQLEVLNLSNNNISNIDSEAFQNCRSLLTINMANNECSLDIDLFMGGILDNSVNIETIDFSHNKITDVNQVITINTRVHWKNLDFSYNDISAINIQDLQPLNPQNAIINLEHNKIHHVNFENVETLSRTNEVTSPTQILLSHNPLTCDCLNYDLLRFLKGDLHSKVYDMFNIKVEDVTCSQPEDTNGILFDKLRLIDVTCPANQLSSSLTCPNDCQCLARPYDKTYIVNCSHLDLTDYPQFKFNINRNIIQIELHLESNNFTRGPSSLELSYYSSITSLYLSHNQIENITSIPPNVQILTLNNNSLQKLEDEFLQELSESSITNLRLDNNPWVCECGTEHFAQFLRNHTKQVNATGILCANSDKSIIDLNKHSLCKDWQLTALIVVLMSVLVICASTVAAYYRYQNEIKVWLFSKQLCLWWVTEEELDKDKIYDAFISYSHKDEDFITENLLPVLEAGPTPYKICLHYRDWIPGEFITTQVANSVMESRRTIIILSKNFMESIWGIHEFKTAHTQAMIDGRARVIVILYGDIDIDSLDSELQAYLKTNTYVKWGDPYFWNKIRYAMPHFNQIKKANKGQKHANLMNFIDDKFNLIRSSVSSNANSTPPIVEGQELAKKHPLSLEKNKMEKECPEVIVK